MPIKKPKFTKAETQLIEALTPIGNFATIDPQQTQIRLFDFTRYPFCKLPIRSLHQLIEKGMIKEEFLDGQQIYILTQQF